AAKLYESGGDFAAAARIVSSLGDHERAATLFSKAGRSQDAARARGEALLKNPAALRMFSSASPASTSDREEALTIARCFEAAGDDRRAADIFARAGDLASAGRLYQKAGAFREASLCHRERGDMTAAANALEAWNPVAAAEAWAEAGR